MNDSLKKLVDILFEVLKNGFYGKFIITIQHGKIVNCEKRESIKL